MFKDDRLEDESRPLRVSVVGGHIVCGPGLVFDLPDAKERPWGRRYAVSAISYKLSLWLSELGVAPAPDGDDA